MENTLKCSVVMTVYNAEKYLKDTIDSVLRQTEKNFELIIVNDCSTDSSEEIIKSYLTDKRIRYFKNKENLKVSKTRNFGVSQAKADYVAFIDSDDIWLDNKLEKQIAFMQQINLENTNFSTKRGCIETKRYKYVKYNKNIK